MLDRVLASRKADLHAQPERRATGFSSQHRHDIRDGQSCFAICKPPQKQKKAVKSALKIGLTEVEVALDELKHFVEELDRLSRQQLVALLKIQSPSSKHHAADVSTEHRETGVGVGGHQNHGRTETRVT